MSTKTLVRENGILVDKNNQPIDGIVKKFKKDIALLANSKADRAKKVELIEQLNDILDDSKTDKARQSIQTTLRKPISRSF